MRKSIKRIQQALGPVAKPRGRLTSVADGLYADAHGMAWAFLQRRVYRRGYWVYVEDLRPLNRPAPEGLPF